MEPLALTADLRLVPTVEGGRNTAILNSYRACFDLGNRWGDEPMLNDGHVMLLDAESLSPGAESRARIEPLRMEYWDGVREGMVIPLLEGTRVVGHATVLEVSWPENIRRPVAEFVRQAYAFCSFMAEAGKLPLPERLQRARHHLVGVYAAGVALPRVEAVTESEGPTFPEPDGWRAFESLESYWLVFDPYEQGEAVLGSLSDDLIDIYRDIREGLWSWEKDEVANAIFDWRLLFEAHWGAHAVNAIRALHRACKSTGSIVR